MRHLIKSTLALALAASGALAQTTSITYQGELKDNAQPASGSYDFYVEVYTQETGGSSFTDDCVNDVPVVDGRFVIEPSFGVLPAGATYYLDIQARRHQAGRDCGTSTGFTRLTPRQMMTPAPFANLARVAMSLSSPDGSPSNAVGVDPSGNVSIPVNLSVAGTSTVSGASTVAGNSSVFGRLGVGINTANTTMPLHVRAEEPIFILQDSGSAATQTGYVGFWNNSAVETAWAGFGSPSSPNFSVVNARANGNIVLSPAGHVVVSSRLGIGNSAPSFPLDIANEEPVAVLRDSGADASQVGYLGFRNGSGTETGWVGYGTPGSPHFSVVNARSTGHILLLPATNGNVGVNTSSPAFKLDVGGNIRCTSLTQTSSGAFKDEVAPLSAGLDDLMRLAPVSYRWNDQAPEDSRGKRDLGFIAEDVEKVLPEIVAKDESGKPVGMDYSRITVVAVKAIQEQQARHEADRAEIASLRERLARLEALLNQNR